MHGSVFIEVFLATGVAWAVGDEGVDTIDSFREVRL